MLCWLPAGYCLTVEDAKPAAEADSSRYKLRFLARKQAFFDDVVNDMGGDDVDLLDERGPA